jgi:hypothetical protein
MAISTASDTKASVSAASIIGGSKLHNMGMLQPNDMIFNLLINSQDSNAPSGIDSSHVKDTNRNKGKVITNISSRLLTPSADH